MPKKSEKGKRQSKAKKTADSYYNEDNSITIGDISGGTGIAIGRGAKATVVQDSQISKKDLLLIFKPIREKIAEGTQSLDKAIAENAIQALEMEAQKGEQAVESNVQKWMNFLAETMPDAWEIAVDTFINPIKGIGTVFRKVAERAKAEQDAKNAKAPKK
jgi:hypothetical protein